MRRIAMKRTRRTGYWMLLLAAIAVLIALGLALPTAHVASEPSPDQVVQGAWQRARQVGVYRFVTELERTTYPASSLANVGRSSRTDTLHIEGQINLPERALLMSLWQGGRQRAQLARRRRGAG
jgi:hypothetical protein